MQIFDNKFFDRTKLELSSNKESIKLSEIDTKIIEINDKGDLDVLGTDNNNINESEIDSNEELIFKGRNSKYPKRVIFALKIIISILHFCSCFL